MLDPFYSLEVLYLGPIAIDIRERRKLWQYRIERFEFILELLRELLGIDDVEVGHAGFFDPRCNSLGLKIPQDRVCGHALEPSLSPDRTRWSTS